MSYEWFSTLEQSFETLLQTAVTFVPRLMGATLVLAVGWLTAWLLRALTTRALQRLSRWIPSRATDGEPEDVHASEVASGFMEAVVFWGVLLFFIAAATEQLGLAVVSAGLSNLARYLPKVLAAALIAFAGFVLGSAARSAVAAAAARAQVAYASVLGQLVRVLVLTVAIVIALDQAGVDSTLLILITAITLGSVVGGAALAFGLGAGPAVRNILASHYLSKFYRVGQRIRIGDVEGRILEIRATNVLLDSSDGQITVPAKAFSETSTILLHETE